MTDIKPHLPSGKNKKIILIGGVAITGAFVFYEYRQNRAASAAVDTTADDGTDTTDNTSAYDDSAAYDTSADSTYGDSGYAPIYGSPYGGTYTPVASANPLPTTNGEWAQAVEDYLSGVGYNEQTVSAALGKYLNKRNLSDSELSIVESGIAFMGYPPNNVGTPIHTGGTTSPVAPVKKPVKKPVTAKTKNVTVTVGPGVTLGTLAQKYYHNHSKWGLIKARNPVKLAKVTSSEKDLKNGLRLVVPNATYAI